MSLTYEKPIIYNQCELIIPQDGAENESIFVECFVHLLDNQIIKIDIDNKAVGKQLLDKLCQKLGIVNEADYFSFRYRNKYQEYLWLNLRNKISHQLPSALPYRLDFKVKYFVLPHTILSDETLHQFYLQAKYYISNGYWNQGVFNENFCQMVAFMTQAEFGNFQTLSSSMKYVFFWPNFLSSITSLEIQKIIDFQIKLKDWSPRKIQYEFLRLISRSVPMYGVTFYDLLDCWRKPLKLGIGPDGLLLCNDKYEIIEKWIFETIVKVNRNDRILEFVILQASGSSRYEKFSQKSSRGTKSLQRCIIETFQFFKCDTVCPDILGDYKTNRHFFRKSNTYKSYFYDIIKTQKEVYDSALRTAYNNSNNNIQIETIVKSLQITQRNAETESINDETVVEMRKELEVLRELIQCVVCKDLKISKIFFPCLHIVCCGKCSSKLEHCPICRQYIKKFHNAFPKWISNEKLTDTNKLCSI